MNNEGALLTALMLSLFLVLFSRRREKEATQLSGALLDMFVRIRPPALKDTES